MPRSCPSCGTEAAGNGTLCGICGFSAAPPMAVDAVADDGEQRTESCIPGSPGASNPADLSAVENPDHPAGFNFHVPIQHIIAAGGVVLAVLAGVAVTAIDSPLHAGFPAGRPRAREQAVPASPVVLVPVMDAPAVEYPKIEEHAARQVKKVKPVRLSRKVVVPATKPLPAVAIKPMSIDEKYRDIVRNECNDGILGLPCREIVRWRLCSGRWNHGGNPGETRCHLTMQDSSDRRFSAV